MGQDLRIENINHGSFITTRTISSRLWFIRNKALNNLVCTYLAKYQERYGVIIYAFVIMGNHYHLVADYPNNNRAAFMRDFNSVFALLTKQCVKGVPDGPFWARRFRSQALVRSEDKEDYFLYASLNPVSSGLVKNLSEYKQFGYNSCYDAINGIQRVYKTIDWRTYRDKSRFNEELTPKDFENTYVLTFSRIPGYEKLSQKEYARTFREKIEARRLKIIEDRKAKGEGFAGVSVLRRTKPGAYPRSTKKSKRNDPRPLILTSCNKTRSSYISFYFSVRDSFTAAYKQLKKGIKGVVFPTGTYHPPLLWATG